MPFCRSPVILVFGAVLLMLLWDGEAAASDFTYVRKTDAIQSDWIIADSRSAELCEEKTLAGARCLPAEDFFGPHRRLPAIADIAWLLGTAGLSGEEEVLVVGDDATDRDFVAGLLYVMGQGKVRILTEPVNRIAASEKGAFDAGIPRSQTRERVYTAPVREGTVIFGPELYQRLVQNVPPLVLDGRPEDAYWGKATKGAQRGGHLPGADHLPALGLRAAIARGEFPGPAPAKGPVVVYGENTHDGVAYFTLVRAGLGLTAQVYPAGWSEWAAASWLADAVTYPADGDKRASSRAAQPTGQRNWHVPSLAVGALATGALLALGFVFGRRRAT